jgi:hypothetical protein
MHQTHPRREPLARFLKPITTRGSLATLQPLYWIPEATLVSTIDHRWTDRRKTVPSILTNQRNVA